MTVRVRAGTTVADLDDALAEVGQTRGRCRRGRAPRWAACSPWATAACAGWAGGRCATRVLEVRYVSAEGTVVKAGGPTVKNVSGFDLCRLLVGSLGTLGLLAEVVLRTRPLPAVERWLAGEADPFALLPRLHRPASVLWDGTTTWVLLEGHPADVEAQARLAADAGLAEAAGRPTCRPHRWSLRPSELPPWRWRPAPGRPRAGSWPRWASASCTADAPAAAPGGRPRGGRARTGGSRTCSTRPADSPRPRPAGAAGAATGAGALMDLGIDDDELAACVCLRPVPAPLPHLPGDGRGGAVAPGPGSGHAPGAVGGGGASTTRSSVDGDVRAVPGLRDGVPVGRAVRPPHRARPRHAGRGPAPQPGRCADRHRPPLALRLAVRSLRWHRLVLAGSSLLGVAQRLRLVPRRGCSAPGSSPRCRCAVPGCAATAAPASGAAETTDVWLFTGCVMDAWMRDIHADVQRVVEADRRPGGAARRRRRLLRRPRPARGPGAERGERHAPHNRRHVPGRRPDPGRRRRLRRHAARLRPPARHGGGRGVRRPGPRRARVAGRPHRPADGRPNRAPCGRRRCRRTALTVAVQDPCHLRHVQRSHQAVRTVLAPFATLVELDDEGLCCGAGGAYAAAQPSPGGGHPRPQAGGHHAVGGARGGLGQPGLRPASGGGGRRGRAPLPAGGPGARRPPTLTRQAPRGQPGREAMGAAARRPGQSCSGADDYCLPSAGPTAIASGARDPPATAPGTPAALRSPPAGDPSPPRTRSRGRRRGGARTRRRAPGRPTCAPTRRGR